MAKQHEGGRTGAGGHDTAAASPAALRERQRAMAASPWPIAIAAAGPAVVGAAAWRWRGLLRVTVVAKATFELVPDGLMRPIRPVEIRRTELHFHNNPARSVSATSDLGLYLERADVTLTGHAYAPGGTPTPKVTPRLRVLRADGSPALDKSIDVYGDRSAWPGEPAPSAQPFQKIPLVYERAYGGIGWGPNPFGIGVEPELSGKTPLPNIVHANAQPGRTDPAGFGPLSPSLPGRRALLGRLPRKALEGRIAEIPDTFEWGYFQAAPLDQRIDFLNGDEWIVLDGVHPSRASLTTRLPGARGLARVLTPTGAELPIELRADTLAIDADASIASVLWRGRFAVSAEESLGLTSVVAGVLIAGAVFEWPAMPVPLAKAGEAAFWQPTDKASFDTTVSLDDESPTSPGENANDANDANGADDKSAAKNTAHPHGGTVALAELPGAQPGTPGAPGKTGENPLEATMQLPDAATPLTPAAMEALLKNWPPPGSLGGGG